MTVAELRALGRVELTQLTKLPEASRISHAQLVREVDSLLCFVLGIQLSKLLISLDQRVEKSQVAQYTEYLQRRKVEEPLAYIIGTTEFYGIELKVSPAVLIPRPETELLVEKSLEAIGENLTSLRLIDVGTGSGAIILAIISVLSERFVKEELARASFVAVDVSQAALEVAERNAKLLGLNDYIHFQHTGLLAGLAPASAKSREVIVANLPYISPTEALPRGVANYEPAAALCGGEQGLEVIYKLLDSARSYLENGAVLLLEIGQNQRTALESRLRELGLKDYRFHRDLSGIERVLEISYA